MIILCVFFSQGPDAVWLENYYIKLHAAANHSSIPSFLAVFVGCNKGFDAVNTIRMGSGKPVFDKGVWRDAITQHGKMKLHHDVCNEVTHPQVALSSEQEVSIKDDSVQHTRPFGGGGGSSSSFSQVHCIEPMPVTARGESLLLYYSSIISVFNFFFLRAWRISELQRAASETKYDEQGFVVMHAAMSKEDGSYNFTQRALIDSIIDDVGIKDSNTKPVPAKVSLRLHAFKEEPVFNLNFNYRSVVGKLNYLAQTTRPDIMYATHQIAKYSSDPRTSHGEAVLYLIRYLKKTRDLGLLFKSEFLLNHINIKIK